MRARVVVNAAGVWSDDVRALDEGTHPASIRPAKGIHIALPWDKVRNDIAAIIPVPGDQRMVFVVPWGDTTYVGTTDTDYDGPLDDPPCTPDDVDYLLAALNGISEEKHTADDVVGTWAGLRPLLRTGRSTRTSDLSRRHTVRVAPSGVVTVTGGKLTTYRRMAADAVDAAVAGLGGNGGAAGPSRTKHLRLFGGEGIAAPVAALEPSTHEHLIGRYGTEADVVRSLTVDDPDLADSAGARAAVPPRRGALRGAARDGPHARRRALTSHPRAAARARRVGRCRGVRRGVARPRSRVVRHRARRRGRGVPGVDRRRTRPDLVTRRR